jgi:hypothetical protein
MDEEEENDSKNQQKHTDVSRKGSNFSVSFSKNTQFNDSQEDVGRKYHINLTIIP